MKKWLGILLMLCLLAGMAAGVLAEEEKKIPYCGNPEHWVGDGLKHFRPEPCWITGHFECDGLDHGKAECKIHLHYVCDGRDHSPAFCGAEGHAVCDWREHETPMCGIAGHCVSDGKNHWPAYCGVAGHYTCDGMSHYDADCNKDGHGDCDGRDHDRASCGVYNHYNCDGADHTTPACGLYRHCVSDGLNHTGAPCGIAGHNECDGKNHNPAPCGVEGHYSCMGGRHYSKPISKYCNAFPQHKPCENNPEHYCDPSYGGCGETYLCHRSNAHTACRMCGLLWCDRSLGGHETPCDNANHRPCVYTMKGKTYVRAKHEFCGYCGSYVCDGYEHGNTKCVPACEYCGYPEKMFRKHLQECGKHYWCLTKGDHGPCKCGKSYVCDENHQCPTGGK
ncbi:MAG: hypothetical protein J6K32_01045 [Clostridia bacterium]|nr:hypothetical protein [Clostridia bacterium]